VTGEQRSSKPAALFRVAAPRSLSSEGGDGEDQALTVALPAGLLRRLWFASAGLGLALVVIAVLIVRMSR
jgi:hypothetical protein